MVTLRELVIFLPLFLTVLFTEPEVVPALPIYFHPATLPANGALTGQQWRIGSDGFHFHVQNPYDGSYHFGYDTGTGSDESYREETRDKNGRVQGRYGYMDPNGILRTVEYLADEFGFRTRSREHVVMDTSNLQVVGPIPKALPRKYYNPYIKSVQPAGLSK